MTLAEHETEQTVSLAIDVYQKDMQRRIRNVMLTRIREWQAQHPQRSVAFMDAMGAVMLHVSRKVPDALGDETYDIDDWHPEGKYAHTRFVRIFKSLNELRDWYLQASDDAKVTINDILVGEPFWPIHKKENRYFECDPREYDK